MTTADSLKPFPRTALVAPVGVAVTILLAAGLTDNFGNTNIHGDAIPVILFLVAVSIVVTIIELVMVPKALWRLRTNPTDRTVINWLCTGVAATFVAAIVLYLTAAMIL